jgi:hypothetical protein
LSIDFEQAPKETLRASVPIEVGGEFRVLAIRSRMRANELLTRLLCAHLGLNVADYGLDPSVPLPQPESVSA